MFLEQYPIVTLSRGSVLRVLGQGNSDLLE